MKAKICSFILLTRLLVCLLMTINFSELYAQTAPDTIVAVGALPQTAAQAASKAYQKAKARHAVPEMMKAYLEETSHILDISPDSLQNRMEKLKEWVQEETDPVHKAILHFLLGKYTLDTSTTQAATIEQVIGYFRLALTDKARLGVTNAQTYRPLTKSSTYAESYWNDNMYQLLAQQSIRCLSELYIINPLLKKTIQCEIRSIFDDLIAFYQQKAMREALLLTCLDKLQHEQQFIECLRVTNDEAIRQLKQWTVVFADSPLCGEIYCQLATCYEQQKDLIHKLEAARTGLTRYPNTPSIHDLKEQTEEVENPRLTIHFPFQYPNKEIPMKVNYRNLKGFTLKLYRISLPVASGLLQQPSTAAFVRQHGKLVATSHYALADTPDYQPTDTILMYPMPSEGIYILQSIPDGHPKRTEYETIYLSSLQSVSIGLPNKKVEVTVVDKLSGHPVKGAEVTYYRVIPGGDFKAICQYTTGANGSVILTPPNSDNWLGMNISYQGKNATEISYDNSSGYDCYTIFSNKTELHTHLFTDRILYRPGQVLHLAGICYNQAGDEIQTVPGVTHQIRLLNENKEELHSLHLKSNSFGKFQGEIMLSTNLLPGEYCLMTDKSQPYFFRIEEYKRPSFEVTFSPYSTPYRMGDSIRLKGKVQTLNGIPITHSRLKYQITRAQNKYWQQTDNEVSIDAGEQMTRADGTFEIPLTFQRPEDYDEQVQDLFYTYRITADVTHATGETQRGSLSLTLGRAPILLHIDGLRSKTAREKTDSIRILAMNLSYQPQQMQAECILYSLDEQGRKTKEQGRFTQTTQQAFICQQLDALPSGRYRMEVSVTDTQGQKSHTQQDFTLFSLSDKQLPYHTLEWFYQDGTEFAPDNKPVDLYVGTSEKDLYLFYDVFCDNRRIESKRLLLTNEIRKFSFSYKPEYGNGISIQLAFLRQNELYIRKVDIACSRPDKQLTLKWKTFRDKLQPGAQEKWEMEIGLPDGQKADASLLVTLYDAALDRLFPHDWPFSLQFDRHLPHSHINKSTSNQNIYLYHYFPFDGVSTLRGLRWWNLYSRLQLPVWATPPSLPNIYQEKRSSRLPQPSQPYPIFTIHPEDEGFSQEETYAIVECESEITPMEEKTPYMPLRENFAETAFFYPDLRTDSTGTVSIAFTLPESLTAWKLLALAHTRDMHYGTQTAEIKAVKPFLIQAYLPRFVRIGDQTVLTAAISNLSENPISGQARLELIDMQTQQILFTEEQPFHTESHNTCPVSFSITPTENQDMLICRFTAQGNGFSDGEQHYLPVLPNQQQLTETVAVQLKTDSCTTIPLHTLYNEGSQTTTHKQLIIELTANPTWYLFQSLPAMGHATDKDALSYITAYYLNSLSAHVLHTHPEIKLLLEANLQTPPTSTIASTAHQTFRKQTSADEIRQREAIALLLAPNQLAQAQQETARQLALLQQADGSLSWYPGMSGNTYITSRFVELISRLKAAGIPTTALDTLYTKAVQSLHKQFVHTYTEMKKEAAKGHTPHLDEYSINYLYICTLNPQVVTHTDPDARNYMIEQLKNPAYQQTIYEKARTAHILYLSGYSSLAKDIAQSILEYTVFTPEMGRYFDTSRANYSPHSYRIPTHVAAMEALSLIGTSAKTMEEMKLWLLKQKQVQSWGNTIATADAIQAFMSKEKYQHNGKMTVRMGTEILQSPATPLGHITQVYEIENINLSDVTFENKGSQTGWGALYATYTEPIKNLKKGKGNGLHIQRFYTLNGKKVTKKTVLHPGDKLTVTLEIKADRDMDFIRITNPHAACMEATESLSGYRHNGIIGYYQAYRDACTELFFDQFPKGTQRISYEIYLDRPGHYQNGAAIIQSAYAPEFSGHSPANTLQITTKDH